MPADRDQDDRPDSNSSQDETNPFVAIRRFADEQVSAVLQSITGLPSTITPPRGDQWTIFTDDTDYRSMTYRQRNGTTSNDPGDRDYTQDRGERSSSGDRQENSYGERKRNLSRPEPSQGISRSDIANIIGFDPFGDRFSLPRPPFFIPNILGESSAAWPMSYLMFSSYSPLNLEREKRLRSLHGDHTVFSFLMSAMPTETDSETFEPQWREAFEDLIRVQNGKPMLDRDVLTPKTTRESGTEWIRQMMKRRSWGDEWYIDSNSQLEWLNRTPKEKSREPDTELGLYEFLQDVESLAESKSPLLHALFAQRQVKQDNRQLPQTGNEEKFETGSWIDVVSGGDRRTVPETEEDTTPAVSTNVAQTEISNRRVISTMTRTERNILPDGSVQTKKVSTKRYDDGSEETDSSTELMHSHPDHKKSDGSDDSDGKPNNGWFWRE